MLVWFTPRERRGFEGRGITLEVIWGAINRRYSVQVCFSFLSSFSYPRSSQNLQRLTLTWPASCRCRASFRRHLCTINMPFGESTTQPLRSCIPPFLPPPFLPPFTLPSSFHPSFFLSPFPLSIPTLFIPILLTAWELCVNLVIYNMLHFVTL